MLFLNSCRVLSVYVLSSDDAIVHYLVEDLWVDVDEATNRGMTALHYAAKVVVQIAGLRYNTYRARAKTDQPHGRNEPEMGAKNNFVLQHAVRFSLLGGSSPSVTFSACGCASVPGVSPLCRCAALSAVLRRALLPGPHPLTYPQPGESHCGCSRAVQARGRPGGEERRRPGACTAHKGPPGENMSECFFMISGPSTPHLCSAWFGREVIGLACSIRVFAETTFLPPFPKVSMPPL